MRLLAFLTDTARIEKKLLAAALFLSLMLSVATISAHGEEGLSVEMPSEFEAVTDALPDEILEQLPEGMTEESTDGQAEALSQMLSPQYWFDVLENALKEAAGEGIRLLATVCGLLMLAAVLHSVRNAFSSEGLRNTVRFCTVGALFATLLQTQYTQLAALVRFFDRLHALMSAMLPVGGALLAMGGNVTTAASGSATLGVFLSVSEGLCAKTVIPVCAIGTALALCRSLAPEIGLQGLANAVRKTYTFTLGLIMTLLCFLLSSQSALCAAADSTGARTAKLVSGMAIPIVGGSVGDTLRTVASGVQYLKSIVGIGGIVFVLLLLLPILLSLLVTRLVFLLGSGVAEMLGCEIEGKLLSELGAVWGTMIAVASMCSVMFILALTVLVRIAVAVG